MKLISWNCQGAFRKKAEFILKENPDVLIIQECENPENLFFNSKIKLPNEFLWFGENKNKGVGVFSYSDYKFKLLDEYNSEFKIVIPILVYNEQTSFTLFAICANNPQDKNNQYIGQVWKAINFYATILTDNSTILIGDFNSNKIWDKKQKIGNHSDVVERLKQKNIFSVYHKYFKEEQGKEQQPTFYLYRHKDKPYHIDYCFVSAEIFEKLIDIKIGSYGYWTQHSDHSPIIVEFEK
jgi:exodeoxyribonuclease III